MTTLRPKFTISLALAGLLTTAGLVGTASLGLAGPGHGPGAIDFGQPGDAAAVDRTIEVELGDNFFEPQSISVGEDETVRFVLRNTGELLHEFNIGTSAMHATHQEEMMTMMEQGMITATGMDPGMMMADGQHGMGGGMGMMAHDDPNSVLVEPGETAELVWTFAHATDLEFACNVPGHYESGMYGPIHFDR